jgi:hypothetical protein
LNSPGQALPFMRFWERLKNIFSTQQYKEHNTLNNKVQEEKLLCHDVIKRCETDHEYYKNWFASTAKSNSLNWLYNEFISYKTKGYCDQALMFLMIPSVNGFAIKFDDARWHQQDFTALFDYFKNTLSAEENYCVQVSDTKTIAKGLITETTERHYLKPPVQFDMNYGDKKNQKFGNLMITLNTINGKIDTLKLSATQYNDHLFERAYPFELLMELLCPKNS